MAEYRRQDRFERRMKRSGFVRVVVWVPKAGRPKVLRVAKELREARLRKLRA